MKSQLHRRLKRLTATIGSRSTREYTLEELCWEYWRRGQRDFMALANGDCSYYAFSLIRSSAKKAAKAIAIEGIGGRVTELERAAAAQKGS